MSQNLTATQQKAITQTKGIIKQNAVALSKRAVSAEMFERVALNALNEYPQLMECSATDLCSAFRKACRDGLLPDGKNAVIYPGRGKNGGYKPIYLPMVTGIVNAAMKAFPRLELRYDAVCQNDVFQCVFGTDQKITHERFLDGERGQIIGAYCCTRKTPDAGWEITLTTSEDLQDARNMSKTSSNGPWQKWGKQMAVKVAIKRSLRFLAAGSAHLQGIIQNDNDNSESVIDDIETVNIPEKEPINLVPKKTSKPLRTAKLAPYKPYKPAPPPAPERSPAPPPIEAEVEKAPIPPKRKKSAKKVEVEAKTEPEFHDQYPEADQMPENDNQDIFSTDFESHEGLNDESFNDESF